MIHSKKKMTIIDHFGASDDQTIRIKKFFWGNRAVDAVEVIEAAEAAKVNVAAEVFKV